MFSAKTRAATWTAEPRIGDPRRDDASFLPDGTARLSIMWARERPNMWAIQMPSDHDVGKKEEEREALQGFLLAYAHATGEMLTVLCDDENPDFICLRPCGDPVGIELTKVTRTPADAFWDHILRGKEELQPFDAQALIVELLERKETARAERYSRRVDKCMLVLQLVDSSLRHLRVALEGLQDEFARHGFTEVWIADYSGLEAFGDIELYGLYPPEHFGLHPRPNSDRKPFS